MKKWLGFLSFILGSSSVILFYRVHDFFGQKIAPGFLISFIVVTAFFGSLIGFMRKRFGRLNELRARRFDFWRAALFLGIGFSTTLMDSFFQVGARWIPGSFVMPLLLYLVVVWMPFVFYVSYLCFVLVADSAKPQRIFSLFGVIAGFFVLGIAVVLGWPQGFSMTPLILTEFSLLMGGAFFVTYFSMEQGLYFMAMLGLMFFVFWIYFHPVTAMVHSG